MSAYRFDSIIGFVAVSALSFGCASAALAANGWQATMTYDFTPGANSQFIHMDCPSPNDKAIMGAFEFNNIGQTDDVSLNYNGPRFDTTPAKLYEWGWHFYWPSGGAKSEETATFSVYCVAKNPK